MNKTKKKDSYTKIIVFGVLMFIVCFALLSIVIGQMTFITDSKLLSETMTETAHSNAWLNYSGNIVSSVMGGIISGSITFLGLYFTIRHIRNVNHDNEAIQIKPYLNYILNKINSVEDEDYSSFIFLNIDKHFIKQEDGFESAGSYDAYLVMENVGLGSALDINFTTIKYQGLVKTNTFHANALKVNGEIKILLSFSKPLAGSTEEPEGTNTFEISTQYKDLLGNAYEQVVILETRFDIEYEVDEVTGEKKAIENKEPQVQIKINVPNLILT